MSPLSQPTSLPLIVASLVLCLLAPGWAWWPGSATLPRAFAAVAASVMLTTVVATTLTALQVFSLSAVLAINAVVTVVGLAGRLLRKGSAPTGPAGLLGLAVFAAALAVYWPAFPTFLGAGDSSAYIASGVWLARSGGLAKPDALAPALDAPMRAQLFDSMAQTIEGGPPYRRMPGAMMLEGLDANTAWPAFFPVPAVWAALATSVLGAGSAGAYAPLFAALGVWAFSVVAIRWFGPPLGLFVTLLAAANGATYWAARFALSEPLAWFFVFCGLAALAAHEAQLGQEGQGSRDQSAVTSDANAVLAGAALGAAVFTRADFALFLGGALLLLPSLRRGSASPQLPIRFFLALLGVALLGLMQLRLLPGSYMAPFTDSAWNMLLTVLHTWDVRPDLLKAGAVAAVVVVVGAPALLGPSRALRWGLVLGFVGAHMVAARFLVGRTPMWLSFYVGWAGLALAVPGAVSLYRRGGAGVPFFLALLAAVSLVLFYNPHVFPSVPWGSRRFVPVLIPGLLLAAGAAISAAWQWRRVAGVAAGLALGVAVWAGGRPVWGEDFYAGVPEQLQSLAAMVPADGVLLISRSLSAQMLGPALWLVYDRNSLTVLEDSAKPGRSQIAALVARFGNEGPLYYLTNTLEKPTRMPSVAFEDIGRSSLGIALLEQTYDQPPRRRQRYLTPITLYRLTPIAAPSGAPTH